jgi:hypothetical protein
LLFFFGFIEIVPLEDFFSSKEEELFAVFIVKLKLNASFFEFKVSQFFKLKFTLIVLFVNGDLSNLKQILDNKLTDGNSNLLFI